MTTWRQHSRSCTGCRSSNGSTINCASSSTKWLFVKRVILHDCSHWCPTTSFTTRQTATTSFPGPVWNSARGRFLLPPRAWNRLPTELKLMRSTPVFKRSLKTFLFQTAYTLAGSRIALHVLNWQCNIMRHRSSCTRRRTKSTFDYAATQLKFTKLNVVT